MSSAMLFSWAAVVLIVALAAALLGRSGLATTAVAVAWLLVGGGLALFLASVQRSRAVSSMSPAAERAPRAENERPLAVRRARCGAAPSMEQEVGRGAVLGIVVGGAFAHWFGAPVIGLIFAGTGGALVGGVAALLIWVGSADLPEDPIPAPRDSPPGDAAS